MKQSRLSAIGSFTVPTLGPVVPYLGVYFDANSGFNFNYCGRLTVTPGQDPFRLSLATANFPFTPVASPDSTKIAWKQAGALWIVSVEGADDQNIRPSTDGAIYAPLWHPDGSKILYVRARSNLGVSPDVVCTIEPDGSNETTLHTAPALSTFVGEASYNFDGTKIAFSEFSGSQTTLYVMNADGSGATQIATMPFTGRFDSPQWMWLRQTSKLVVVNTNTLASPIRTLMDDDGTNTLTVDSGTTRRAPQWANCMPDDSAYAVPTSDSNTLALVALDGSGATSLVDLATAGAQSQTSNAFPLFGRIYWDSGDDIYSCLEDGTDVRNESAGTTNNLGLTG